LSAEEEVTEKNVNGNKKKKKEHAKEADRLYQEEEETLWFCIEMRAAYRRNFFFSFHLVIYRV
jgi:hypothetical protein